MGVAVAALSVMGQIEVQQSIMLLAIGVACIGIRLLGSDKGDKG